MTKKLYIRVDGIYCKHCIETIKLALRSLDGVESATLRQNVAEIFGESLPRADVIIDTIRKSGYETDERKISANRSKVSRTVKWYEFLLIAGAIIALAAGVRLIFGYNVFNAIPAVDSSLSYGMLFVTGLLTSIHCVGMCGAIGIFASSESNSVRSFKRPLLYNAGRVITYTVIGGVVGAVGSAFSVSVTVRGIIILVAAVFMLLMALSMTGLFSFRLPRLFTVRTNGKKLGAFVIGLLNGLMPCGPLQAMQIYALSTGSFSPKAYYQQSGGVLKCTNCGFTFEPEQVGITAGGCNPWPIDGVSIGENEIKIPVSSLDGMRSTFTSWAGPTK